MEKKKLIEVALPLEAINAASAREKSIRHGHPSTLHLWWARRPLAVCRAVLFAQLVDDPSAHPDEFPTEKDQERERQRLFRIIEELVLWENTNNEAVLERARAEIRKSCGDDLPSVYDPFCGGGSIPLEAQRLGLKAYGSDLNPVAVMISKGLVEIPPKFAGQPPVNPESQAELDKGGTWNAKGAQGLADDVRYYGQWMRDEAEKRIGHLYPQVDLPSEHGGGKATVIAWLWTRTVTCSNPVCKKETPLLKTFVVCSKKGKERYIVPRIIGGNVEFEISKTAPTAFGDPNKGFKRGTSGIFECIHCGTVTTRDYVSQEGKARRLGVVQTAVVVEGNRKRIYLSPDVSPLPQNIPSVSIAGLDADFSPNPRDVWCRNFGLNTPADLFHARQLLALTTFSDLVPEARQRVLDNSRSAGLATGDQSLDAGGSGAEAYAEAVTVYLGFAVDRASDAWSTIVSWRNGVEATRGTFARQALPMVWDYAEANPFSNQCGNWNGACVEWIFKALTLLPNKGFAQIIQKDAVSIDYPIVSPVISTDPPYYDNIGYADLSDYFYVWMRRALQPIFPKLFGTILVPKEQELTAMPYRQGGRKHAEVFFLDGMTKAIRRMAEQSNEDFPVTIYYAFKQAEIETKGIASTGWATFLEAVSRSDFAVVGTWPVRTERSARSVSIGTNALASSIVLVCRKRPKEASTSTRADFLKSLNKELPSALKLLQSGNIAPVDMAQASIGPGMAVFTRYAKVLEADDSPMTVKTALQLINQELDEYLSEQEADYDLDTRFAITWFETNGLETGQYGEAEVLANARGVAVPGVVKSGILEARGGNVRLLRREEMLDDWDPATDQRLTIWECTQHLIRALETEGEAAAADLLHRLGSRGETARDLAYRLYGICDRKSWADEGLAYNGLVVAWPEILRLAAQGLAPGPAEPELALEPGEA